MPVQTITLERYLEWDDEQRQAMDDFLLEVGGRPEVTFQVHYDDGFVETWEYREDERGMFFLGIDDEVAWKIVQFARTEVGWVRVGEQRCN